jgi:ABC-type uncharacterized transport system ATPase subunit
VVCERVANIDRGRVVQSGRLDDVVRGEPELSITLDRVDSELLSILGRFGSVRDIDATTVRLVVADISVAAVIADVLPRGGYRVFSLTPLQRSLEDVFISLVEGGEP